MVGNRLPVGAVVPPVAAGAVSALGMVRPVAGEARAPPGRQRGTGKQEERSKDDQNGAINCQLAPRKNIAVTVSAMMTPKTASVTTLTQT